MKYRKLMTDDIYIAELQSQYKSTWHLIHLIVTVLFVPWIIIWICQYFNNKSHNLFIDSQIEKRVEEIKGQ